MAGRFEASKTLKHFDGEGDVSAWLSKLELVAQISGVKEPAQLVPLYLESSVVLGVGGKHTKRL